MPEFPSYKGRARKVHYNEAHFGVGTHEFKIQAYGWANLYFMLDELQESIEYAKKQVQAEMDKESL